jgi:hypothetical protein
MARRRPSYPEKPWKPDISKWVKLLDKDKEREEIKSPDKPVKDWQLWRWDTLEDVPQNERQ